ncbi:hypothetical protein LTR82_006769 [Friedmanniomyces endolithicus]|uniref:PNPLA domain-containing protein n=1 Tax=Friedmanniomyces endolithicus TaxID=329885 RepID=A0AAN6FU13_9PEZI|nr:hypothetical protein LTR82_006769 [Friedmanniomyces endolithicus]
MDEQGRLRRKDTTKGPPLRILSLDGGGVRGYSTMIILQDLMHRIFVEMEGRAPKRNEIPKPCDHFDLIAGTGTGGLIAIMLGRLRLDLDTCKDVYVRMTRRVFETDKTFAGIPYKSTMFKASKLEEAIRECVRTHTVFEDEGNDVLANAVPMSADVQGGAMVPDSEPIPQRTSSSASRYSQVGMSPISSRMGPGYGSLRWGNANAQLYDTRENRTKTAVAAVFKGTNQTVLLRSYDSRREPAPDVKCTIWEAGRATCATAMAFKPIQIGQSQYLDEGAGKYNPSPLVLDEAVQNEWPGREVGVFVNADNYYRLNVEVGVGEFGMNEWARLSEISTSTRTYLARRETEGINQPAAAKMAKIHFAKIRHERAEARRAAGRPPERDSWQNPWDRPLPSAPPSSNPMAVELPGDDGYYQTASFRPGSQQYEHRPSIADQKYVVVPNDGYAAQQQQQQANDSPRTPTQRPVQPYSHQPSLSSYSTSQMSPTSLNPASNGPSPRHSHDSVTSRPSPPANGQPRIPSGPPPPLPPKTPFPYPLDTQQQQQQLQQQQVQSPQSPLYPAQYNNGGGGGGAGLRTFMNMGELGRRLPYPEDVEGPPPPVNLAGKPTLMR